MVSIEEKTILEIKNEFKKGTLSSEELVMLCIKRIINIDNGTPKYNSVLEMNPDALYDAKIKDIERRNGKDIGFLHGIPVLLKDNINTSGKMHTSAGSIALQHHFAHKDATLVTQLKKEGAIILGKTNLTEFANFMAYGMRNGYSSLGGSVLCPYNIEKDPSGSSSGSAVAVSLNLAPIAIGTETGGSIMSPAMQNGIVGIKPTIGLVSRTGIIPISSTLDTAGPMAKTVHDAAFLLSAMRCSDDDIITQSKSRERIDYTTYLLKDPNIRLGICYHNFDKLPDDRKKIVTKNINILKKSNITIIDDIKVPVSSKIVEIMIYEFKRNINNYLQDYPDNNIKTLHDIIEFNKKHKDIALKYGQEMLEKVEEETTGRMNEPEYLKSLEERNQISIEMQTIFDDFKLDAIYFVNYTSIGPQCGFPTMTIPIGVDSNHIPVGMYLLSNYYREDSLINVASYLEQLVGNRINPLKK